MERSYPFYLCFKFYCPMFSRTTEFEFALMHWELSCQIAGVLDVNPPFHSYYLMEIFGFFTLTEEMRRDLFTTFKMTNPIAGQIPGVFDYVFIYSMLLNTNDIPAHQKMTVHVGSYF